MDSLFQLHRMGILVRARQRAWQHVQNSRIVSRDVGLLTASRTLPLTVGFITDAIHVIMV